VYVVPMVLLFAIPLLGARFANHAIEDWDNKFLDTMRVAVRESSGVSAQEKLATLGYYTFLPASVLCKSGHGRRALPTSFVRQFCGDYQQLGWILETSIACFVLGVFSVLVVMGCTGLSFLSRETQLRSFALGWSYLRIASAVQVVTQGFIAVMLSFWATAFFFDQHFVKLVAVLGLLTLAAAALVIGAIFRKPETGSLAEEPAQLGAEDSPSSRELAVLLSRYAAYLDALGAGVLSRPVFHLMLFYRGMFQLSLSGARPGAGVMLRP
jgi:hypothetical protein